MAGLGDLLGLMRDAGALKKKIEDMRDTLAAQTFEGSAGGDRVTATVSGTQELLGLQINPEVVNRDEVELLEDMIRGAVGQALTKARELQKEEMSKLMGGLPLPPGLGDLMM